MDQRIQVARPLMFGGITRYQQDAQVGLAAAGAQRQRYTVDNRHDDISDQQVEPLDFQRLQRLLTILHIRHGKPGMESARVTKVRTATSSSATRTRGTVKVSDAAVIGVAHDRIRENAVPPVSQTRVPRSMTLPKDRFPRRG
jgi:hypothetical protein